MEKYFVFLWNIIFKSLLLNYPGMSEVYLEPSWVF